MTVACAALGIEARAVRRGRPGADVRVVGMRARRLDRLATTAGQVLLLGIAMMTVSFGVMFGVSHVHAGGMAYIGGAGLVIAAIAYTFVVAAATMMIAGLAPGSEGSAMGLLNGIIAGGAVIGALVPSYVAKALGYSSLTAMAAGILILAALVGIPLFRRSLWLGGEHGQAAHS